jgi:predicted nucleic acid-binding protein
VGEDLSGDEPVGIPVVVLLAFVRLMTHPTLCEKPMTVAQVRARVDAWLAVDGVRLLFPSPATINQMLRLLEHAGLGGNLTSDALIAAHALELGGRVTSNDADFARFPGVVCENPCMIAMQGELPACQVTELQVGSLRYPGRGVAATPPPNLVALHEHKR